MISYSLIVPIYNSESYLFRCLNSLTQIKYSNVQFILIDDGSTDNSAKIALWFVKHDERFKYFYKKNSGPASARNYGIKKSKGEYICFVDSDDEVLPNKYFKTINKILSQNPLDILEFNAFSQDGKVVHFSKPNQVMSGLSYLKEYLNENNYLNVVPWTKVVSSKYIKLKQLYFENTFAEDDLWAHKLFVDALKVLFIDQPIYIAHPRKNSISSKRSSVINIRFQQQNLRELEQFYISHVKSRSVLNVLRNDLCHNFIAISVLNLTVDVSWRDRNFCLRNAKTFLELLNALLFCISPTLRRKLRM